MRTIYPSKATLVPQQAKLVFKGEIFDVYQWQQKMFDGTYQTFEMLKRADTVKIIAIKDDKIVMLEQEQPHTLPFIDMPGGMHDLSEETELEAAKRELREETGLVCKQWKLLRVVQSHTKIEAFAYTFLAYDVEKELPQELDAGERITLKLMTVAEVKMLANDPRTRYFPREIFDQVESIKELIALPAQGETA